MGSFMYDILVRNRRANVPEEARAAGLIVALSARAPLGCAEYMSAGCDKLPRPRVLRNDVS